MSPAAKRPDPVLLARLRAGDEHAWRDLVLDLKPRIVAVIKRKTRGDIAEAEGIALHALERAHRAIGRFRADCAIESWIFGIALNLAHNLYWYHFRRRRADHVGIDYTPDNSSRPLSEAIPDANVRLVDEIVHRETIARINAALPRIPGEQRAALELCIAGKQYHEIAEFLGIALGTVKSRIARARESLRAELLLAS